MVLGYEMRVMEIETGRKCGRGRNSIGKGKVKGRHGASYIRSTWEGEMRRNCEMD